MNELLKNLKTETNYRYTENGALTHKSTLNDVLDMFAMGGSMRNRSDDDVINMFKRAYEEDATLALKCLFYLRDCRGGAGERRFFRVCLKWLAQHFPNEAEHLIPHVPTYGRYDDLYVLENTPCEETMFQWLHNVVFHYDDHLVYKWLKSENCSSKESKRIALKTRQYFGMTSRDYRKMLSEGRKACHLVETLMSQNQWDQIAFDHLPSRAGLLYKNAFMRREETKERYAEFMSHKDTKVNASVLNPVEIAHQILTTWRTPSATERQAWQKYWDNLKDYYNGREEPGIAVVDVSGSMSGTPMEAAVSMGAYIAERGKGPFQNHFITFSANPELVEFEGVDIYDKFKRAVNADWGQNTNLEAVFDMLLKTGLRNHVPDAEMPKTIYIFSDMEFDNCLTCGARSVDRWGYVRTMNRSQIDTLVEAKTKEWIRAGYTAPRVIFWNLDARQSNIPAIGPGFSYCSGFSMSALEGVLSGKDGVEMMRTVLEGERYAPISSVL